MRPIFGIHFHKAAPILAVSITTLLSAAASGADVYMKASDAVGTSSFNSGVQWFDGAAPTAGNNYYTGTYQLRTPTTGDWTFGGDSLTLQTGGSMLFKGPGTVTVNLVMDGGLLAQGQTGATPDDAKLAGTIKVLSGGTIDTTTNGNRFVSISSLISGSGNLTVQGSTGTVRFTNGANTWTGALTLGTGANTVLELANITNGGIASSLGASSSDASNIILNTGTIRITGTGGTTDRLFTLAGNGGVENNSASAPVTFTNLADIAFSGTGNRTFTLGGSNTGANTFAPRITDNPNGGVTAFTKSGAGTWTLQGTNTYTGATNLNAGTLVFSNLANLGAGTAINMGGGTLRWAGGNTVDVTSRTITATAGTNTFDTNGQDVTLAGVLTGTGAFRKTGSGRLTLSGENTFTGGFTINNGNVRVTSSNALGTTTSQVVIDGNTGASGALELANNISIAKPILLNARQGGTIDAPHIINVSGNNTIAGQINLTTGGSDYNLESQSGLLVLSGGVVNTNLTGIRRLKFSGAGNGQVNGIQINSGADVPIVMNGTGTWVIAGPSNYTGTTSVNSGTLITNTAATGIGGVTVADNAAFGVRVIQSGQSYAPSTLTIGTAIGGKLIFDLGAIGNPTAGVINTSTFTPNGSVKIDVSGSNLSLGQFKLVDYTTIGGTGFAGLSLGTLPPRVTASLIDNTADLSVDLKVIGFDFPRWTGATNGDWDIDNGTGTGTTNWREVTSNNATKYLQGAAGTDSVLFDDLATGTTAVNLTTTLTPTSVLVNNTSKNYTFTGNGKLSGATGITKQGTGMLILANTGGNDFTGSIAIQGGTIQLGDGATVGGGAIGTVNINVDQGASLALNRPDAYALSNVIAGAGTVSKIGAGTVTITANNSNFTGKFQATGGTVKVGSANALGSIAGVASFTAGATLDVNGLIVPAGKVIEVSGAGVNGDGAIVNGVANATIPGLKNLTLTGDTTIGGAQRWDVRDSAGGVIGNGFTVTKKGTNDIYFKDVGETNLGNLEIVSGALGFEGNSTMGSTGSVTVRSGARLGLFNNTATNTKSILLDSGTISAGGGTANAIAGNITASGTAGVDVASGVTLTLSGLIDGSGSVTKTGAGTVVVTGTSSFTGGLIQNGGTLNLQGTNAFSGGFTVNTGTANITTKQSYTGGTTIASGATVNVGVGTAAGSLSSGPITNNGTLRVNRYGTDLVLAGDISGGGVFEFGAGAAANFDAIITLSGNNSFTSNVNAVGGGLRITNSNALGVGPKTVSLNNGTAGRPNLRLASTTTPIVLDSAISFNTSNINGDGAIVNESGDNVIKGNVTLTAGGGDTALNVLSGSLTTEGTFSPNTSNRGLVLRGTANGYFNGSLNDNGTPARLLKEGTGTWELNGSNTYAGATTINGGTLLVNGSIDGSAVTVNAGGTLGGSGTIQTFGNTLTVAAGGRIAPGKGIGNLTVDTNFNLLDVAAAVDASASGTFAFELSTVAASDKLTLNNGFFNIGSGVLEFDDFSFTMAPGFTGGTYTLLDSQNAIIGSLGTYLSGFINGVPAQIALGDGGNDIVLTVVPEPNAALLLLGGVGSLLGTRRMRRRQS